MRGPSKSLLQSMRPAIFLGDKACEHDLHLVSRDPGLARELRTWWLQCRAAGGSEVSQAGESVPRGMTEHTETLGLSSRWRQHSRSSSVELSTCPAL
jgi:hypothetical protein